MRTYFRVCEFAPQQSEQLKTEHHDASILSNTWWIMLYSPSGERERDRRKRREFAYGLSIRHFDSFPSKSILLVTQFNQVSMYFPSLGFVAHLSANPSLHRNPNSKMMDKVCRHWYGEETKLIYDTSSPFSHHIEIDVPRPLLAQISQSSYTICPNPLFEMSTDDFMTPNRSWEKGNLMQACGKPQETALCTEEKKRART